MSAAHVTELDSLVAFRAALIVFAERADSALGSLRQECRRTLMWLEQERPRYWQDQIRRGYDKIGTARSAYDACRMRTVAGHRSACLEEQQALRKAQARVAYCQEQEVVTRRATFRAQEQAEEFTGQLGPLERTLEHDLPQMIGALERMILAIEAYHAVAPSESALPPVTPPGEEV